MIYKITIPQTPIPQPRHRVLKNGFSFDPAKEKKNFVRMQMMETIDFKLNQPIEITMLFYMPIPKATSKKKKALMIENKIPHTKKPDIDNIIKFYMDAMTGVVIYDDNQIHSLTAKKLYSDTPRTEIIITADDHSYE